MTQVKLLKGWEISQFGELVAESFTGLVRSVNLQGEDRQYKYLKMNNLSSQGEFNICNLVNVDADEKEVLRYRLNKGDFIFNTRNNAELVGKCGVFSEETASPVLFNNNLLKVIFYHINPRIVAYWLNSPVGKGQLRDITSATTSVAAIYQKQLFGLDLPIPPLAEQKVIADKLDTLLAQVETTKARLERIPQILKTFRQSVLAAAVSGKLTEQWRGTADLVEWKNVKLDQIVVKIEAGKNLKCIETPPQNNEFGIIKISAVTWGRYDEEQSKTLPDKAHFLESRRIAVGDFLISRANTIELLGNPVIVHEVTKNLMLSDKVLRLVMDEENKPWVSMFLRSKRGRKEIESRSTGNQMSMRNIGQKALLDIDLPKPPIEEQTQIVRRVEELFGFADNIEQKANAALERVNNLTQSILAKAFRGELTADWRAQNPDLISGDNSAEALLEKIKAEREALSSKKKPKKKAVKKVK